MISKLKNSLIFVMQTTLKYHGCFFISKTAQTKKQGRHTGASPEARLKSPLGVVCGDLPPLFNLNLFSMQTTKSNFHDAKTSTIVAGQPAKPFWESNPENSNPLIDFCRKVGSESRVKRLTVHIKANGVTVVCYRNNRVISAFGYTLENAVEILLFKVQNPGPALQPVTSKSL